jgi:hypothetical protein
LFWTALKLKLMRWTMHRRREAAEAGAVAGFVE